MKYNNYNKDVYKEVFVFISNFEEELLEKIPDEFLQKLSELSADSDKEYYIEEGKMLEEQNMSEECKEILELIYYKFIENK